MDLFRAFKAFAEWRRKRDEAAWKLFEGAKTSASAHGARFADVVLIRQQARTGSKAYVRWVETGGEDAVWSEAVRLHKGQVLPLSGSRGHGRHHSEPVLYIHHVGPAVARRVYRGWARHEARRVREGPKWLKPVGADDDAPF